MSVKSRVSEILSELVNNQSYLNDEQLNKMIEAILNANHIFTAGAGRSGVAIRAFTNRLMHLGFSVSNIGEITTPHSAPGDLLIIGSGSGETESLISLAKKAQKGGVEIAVITMDENSTIAKMAKVVVVLPVVSPKLKNKGISITSTQPMGSAFEQMMFLTYDGIIMELMDRMGQTSDEMFLRHADFE